MPYGELPLIETATGEKIPGFPVSVLNPPKTAVVRLPTSVELMTFLSAQRSLYRDLGRRTGQAEDLPTPKADQALFNAIRIDKDGEAFDDAEAAYAIGIVTRHKVTSCERQGQEYVVTVNTMFGETVHTVGIPFQADMAVYRRSVYKPLDLPHGVEERRFPPEAPVNLYDKVFRQATGYSAVDGGGSVLSSVIPPHHKRAVVNELMTALSLLDPDFAPNF